MEEVLSRIKKASNWYSKEPTLLVVLPVRIANIIGDKEVYISDFVVAKILGKISTLNNHPEITEEILLRLSNTLIRPNEIIEDTRKGKKYLFIGENPLHQIVIEIRRSESGKSEINTIFRINSDELKRLERKFPVVYSVGGTPTPSSSPSQQGRFSGVN